MWRLIVFVIWCVVLLSGAMLIIMPPRSWQCTVDLMSQYITRYYPPSGTVIRLSIDTDTVEVWREGDSPVAQYVIEYQQRTNTTVDDVSYSPIQSAVLSPDGNTIASMNENGLVALWEVTTGKTQHIIRDMLPQIKQSSAVIYLNGFSTDGRYLILFARLPTTLQTQVNVWEINNGQHYQIASTSIINLYVISNDGSLLITSDTDGVIQLWDVKTGQVLRQLTPPPASVGAIQFSPDNKLIIAGDESGNVTVWDIASGKILQTLPAPIANVYNRIRDIAILPDNRTILPLYADGTVILWDIQSGKQLQSFEDSAAIDSIYVNADGSTLMTTSGHFVRTWDLHTGQMLRTLKQVTDAHFAKLKSKYFDFRTYMLYAAFSPDSKKILTSDEWGVTIWWDAQTGDLIRPLCPRVLDQRWIVAGIGLCTAAMVAAGWYVIRTAKG